MCNQNRQAHFPLSAAPLVQLGEVSGHFRQVVARGERLSKAGWQLGKANGGYGSISGGSVSGRAGEGQLKPFQHHKYSRQQPSHSTAAFWQRRL